MIVKNEAEIIEDCILSINEWVDEIVIVDTGSIDKTIDIIAKFPKVRLFEQKWKEDFSFHRNYSMEKATQDWIFIIDADERVIPGHGENLKRMLPEIKEPNVIAVDVYNLYLNSEGIRVSRSHFKSLRLFRRSSKPKYEGRIHNRPVIPRGSKVYMLPMRINHFGYDMSQEVMDVKYARTVEMCKRWVREEPKEREAWFQLARAMKVKGGKLNTDEMPYIMDALQKGIALGDGDDDHNHLHLQMLNLMGWMKYATGEHNEAINYGKRAVALKSDYIDAILLIGLGYTYGVDALKGEEWLQRYLRTQEAYQHADRLDGVVMEHANDRVLAYKTLIDIEGWKEKNQGAKT
jgi:glycosyltransferase involved in cell wall biosynthesis